MTTTPLPPATRPATVVYSWTVLPGQTDAFLKWFHGITKAAVAWPGHLGVTTLRPPAGGDTYQSVLRFDSSDHLAAWLHSAQRREWIEQLGGIAVAHAGQKATGLESWFDLADTMVAPPPKWKMVVVTAVAVYPLSLLLAAFVTPHILHVNVFARALLFPVLVPLILTYFFMPFLTHRVFRNWLYKRP